MVAVIAPLTYLPMTSVHAEPNERNTVQAKIGVKKVPVHRFFIGGKIGVGVGLPYGSPFPGLGAELDVTKNLALLVGGTKLAGWIGAMGAWSYVGHPNAVCPHLSAYVWPEG